MFEIGIEKKGQGKMIKKINDSVRKRTRAKYICIQLFLNIAQLSAERQEL